MSSPGSPSASREPQPHVEPVDILTEGFGVPIPNWEIGVGSWNWELVPGPGSWFLELGADFWNWGLIPGNGSGGKGTSV